MKWNLVLLIGGLLVGCLAGGATASVRGEGSEPVVMPDASPQVFAPAGVDSSRAVLPRRAPVRERLEDIRIEGELIAPEVLFITGRDRARFRDPLHRRMVLSVEELGRIIVPLRELCFPLPGF